MIVKKKKPQKTKTQCHLLVNRKMQVKTKIITLHLQISDKSDIVVDKDKEK